MDKNLVLLKLKFFVKDLDEELEISDEEIEDEDQVEGGFEYEFESDESIDIIKKKLISILFIKQQVYFFFLYDLV